tara:strand:+ start:316 stop:888 length:573 start_codon:yes stop_codon:yes gene_type:complete
MLVSHDETVKELQDAAIAAGLHYEIWWVFKSKETRPKYIGVMNQYLTYFKSTISAHFVAMLVCLYRLYETRKDTHNIPTLIDRLEKEGTLESNVVETLRGHYAKAKPLWVKVSILRNDVFGHRSMDIDTDAAFTKAGVTGDELKELVEITKELLNELTLHLRDSTHAFNLSANQATINLLEALKNHAKAL